MNKLLIVVTLLFSMSSFAQSVIANRNCDLALDFDFAHVDSEELGELLTSKGYSFELEEPVQSDFLLEEEFLLSVTINDELPVAATAVLTQKGDMKDNSKIIYENVNKSFTIDRLIINAIKDLPSCVLN